MAGTRVKDIKEGYAIVEYKAFNKYGAYTFIFEGRLTDDLDDAKYQVDSLVKCDHINYAVYDCKSKRLVY
jgi:hypothetical protein